MGNNKEEFYNIHEISVDKKNVQLNIIFIHGLNGHPETTWGNINENFWPHWLDTDFNNVSVWTMGYDATPSAWINDTMSMEKRSLNMLNKIHMTVALRDKPLFFIVHSMGGLILKYLLERSSQEKKYNSIVSNTKGIAFLATPHTGAYGGDILKALSIIYRANDIVKQLSKNNSSLSRLEDAFYNMVSERNFKCISFYETKQVRVDKKFFGLFKIPFTDKIGLTVVNEESAKGRFIQDTPLPVDRNHIDICKLKSRTDIVYENILALLDEILSDSKDKQNESYHEIINSLDEPATNKPSIDRIFLIFDEDNISSTKYKVTGYVQDANDFESEVIDFSFEDIYNVQEQETFLDIIHKKSELVNVPIHFILPPSLFLVNFKQWKYRGSDLVQLYPILLHNKENFSKKIRKYDSMISNWTSLFKELKDKHFREALLDITSSEERFDVRSGRIGVCIHYHPDDSNVINDTLRGTNIGLWQYPSGELTNYQEWLSNDIILDDLHKESNKCDHMALLWDEMSLLENLKRKSL